MEPFGLFQILQSFLAQNPHSSPQTDNAEESADVQNVESPPAPPPASQGAPTQDGDSTNQAILSFMETHDTRARRIKKL